MTFRPLGTRVLVKPFGVFADGRPNIIEVPDQVKENMPHQGKVLAVGEGSMGFDSKLIPLRVKVGDVVLFHSRAAGVELKMDGEDYLLLDQQSIMGVVE